MRKLFLPALLCLMLLTGCIGGADGPTTVVGFTTVTTEDEESCGPGVPAEGPEELTLAEGEAPDLETEAPALPEGWLPEDWLYASGAGGWGTELHLGAMGRFTGEYHDSDMGVTGPEYPNGTVYISRFSGQFGGAEPREDGAWTLPILSLEVPGRGESEWIEDGILYIASEPFGMAGAEELIVYPAGFPMADLPEEFYAGWAQEYLMNEEALPFWVLYNETEQWGFVEYEFSE